MAQRIPLDEADRMMSRMQATGVLTEASPASMNRGYAQGSEKQ
jgi:hypothetical protein